jgi:hypothetical protein
MYTLPEMFKRSSFSEIFLPFAARGEPERKLARRHRRRNLAPLPWKFALPLIVALSLALWAVIIFAAERLITAII